MAEQKNIVLIGMPGSGKSTIGRLLAKALCMNFLDTDILIQHEENQPLQKIINIKGNEYFLRREEEVLMALPVEGTVIATGGSAVLLPHAMDHLRKTADIVYLEADYGLIRKRLWNLKTRGIVLAPGKTLEDLYVGRKPHYEKYAGVTVRVRRRTPEEIVSRTIGFLGRRRCDLKDT
jgi:shikimate kinase